ncbi:MAG: hypothetical protein D6791_18115 [Chloroflexi bacterium]|nr:MAG: hypothetical protein D6791_18115 [Chloroflexota bacterium]
MYTVTETSPGAEWTVSGSPTTVTVPTDGGTGTATISNTRKLGSLEVTKVVNWNGVTPDTGQTFEICITGASYPSGNCQNADYDGGVLSWNNLIPGVYTVTETSPGAEWTVSGSPTTVTVPTDGGTGTATITNTHLHSTISGLVWNDLDANGFMDGLDAGLADVEVALYRTDDTLAMTTTTGIDGTYTFTDVIPTSYYLLVSMPPDVAFAPKQTSGPPGQHYSIFDPVSCRTDTLTPQGGDTVVDQDGGVYCKKDISGMVFLDVNQNAGYDQGEPGLKYVWVSLYLDDGDDVFDSNADTLITSTQSSGVDGTFLFSGLDPGTYFVVETNPGNYGSTTPDVQTVAVEGSCPASSVAATVYFGDVSPTAVTLMEFVADVVKGKVHLSWQTSFEQELSGFVVWRSVVAEGPYKPVSPLIPATNSPTGAAYEWFDTGVDSASYWYQLQSLPDEQFFGPLNVRPEPETGYVHIYMPMVRR